MLNNKQNYILVLICGFLFAFINGPLTIIPLIIILFGNFDNIYMLLIMTPILGFFGVIFPGFTISRVIVFIYLLSCIKRLMQKKIKIKINMYTLLIYIFLIIVSLGCLVMSKNANVLYFISSKSIFVELFNKFSKVIVVLFLTIDLGGIDRKIFKDKLHYTFFTLPFLLLPLIIYALTFGAESIVSFGLNRSTVMGMDQNELSSNLCIFSIILIYNTIINSEKKVKFISLVTFLLSSILIFNTLSRSGIISLTFITLISIITIQSNWYKKIIGLCIPFLLITILVNFDIIDLEVIVERFGNLDISASSHLGALTSGRIDMWGPAMEYIWNNEVFLGLGITEMSERFITKKMGFSGNVIHNMYLEVFIQSGIVGITSFLIILFMACKCNKKELIFEKKPLKLMLISLCISGLSLNLAFREITWILIGFNFAGNIQCSNKRLGAEE